MDVVLGLDVGEKKIGVAIGDTDTAMAFPRPPILVEDWPAAWPILQKLIKENGVTNIIVGLPLDMNGSSGAQAQRIQEFIALMHQHVSVPIVTRDERLTTTAVQKEQVGRPLRRGEEDSLAAQLLLESYLQERR